MYLIKTTSEKYRIEDNQLLRTVLQSTHTNPAAAVPFAGNSAGDSLREGCF
jgi:hypothetical protein